MSDHVQAALQAANEAHLKRRRYGWSSPDIDDLTVEDPDGIVPSVANGLSADDAELAAFTVGSREIICPDCWLLHRKDMPCP
jgi:hypothetical protein